MHQTQGVAHLVRGDIAQRLRHHVVVEGRLAHAGVDGCGLGKAPLMNEGDDIVIPHHLAHQDFSGAGVYVARSGGVGSTGGHVADTVIADIVGVEVGVVGGVVLGDHHVLEAGSFKGLVPVFDTSLDGSPPLLGEGRVYIVHYLLLGLNQLAVVVLLQVFVLGLHAPAVDEFLGVDVVLVG